MIVQDCCEACTSLVNIANSLFEVRKGLTGISFRQIQAHCVRKGQATAHKPRVLRPMLSQDILKVCQLRAQLVHPIRTEACDAGVHSLPRAQLVSSVAESCRNTLCICVQAPL